MDGGCGENRMALWFVPAVDLRTGSWTSNPAKQYNHKANMSNTWQSNLNSLNLRSLLAVVRLKRGQPGV